jgi:hypothetical protein
MQSWEHTSSPLASRLRASLRKLKKLDAEMKNAKGKRRKILFDRMRDIVDTGNRCAGDTYGVPWPGFNGKNGRQKV